MKNSGKLVIIGILVVALVSAATSWWFRYKATHQAAEFWGPAAARLIRDAPHVSLERLVVSMAPISRDISAAPGITHLRNALLEDRSFKWGQKLEAAPKRGGWKLTFSDPASGEQLPIILTTDCRGAVVGGDGPERRVVSTEPISKGLIKVFAEHFPETEEPTR